MDYLSSVMAGALGKQYHVCRVPRPLDTRQTRRDCLRAVTLLFFCQALVSALSNIFAECPIKNTQQINFCRHCVRRVLFAECFLGFAVCLGHTAKILFPVVIVLLCLCCSSSRKPKWTGSYLILQGAKVFAYACRRLLSIGNKILSRLCYVSFYR